MTKNSRCPTCGKVFPPTLPSSPPGKRPPWAPFCSDRCKMADLGRWLRGGYAIADSLQTEEAAPATDPEEA